MEIINENKEESSEEKMEREKWERGHRMSKIYAGVVLVAAGALLLIKKTGGYVPEWIFTWPMILILAGIGSGIKHSFRRPFAWIFMILGGIFLSEHIITGIALKPFVWPIAIILVGLFIIFKPRRKYHYWKHHHRWHHHHQHWHQYYQEKKKDMSTEDFIDVNAVFGSAQRNIISKNFKGGEVNAVFGGIEINLSQADIDGRVALEMNQVFGGAKLIVPAHWEIRSEINAVFGGIEDKRQGQAGTGLSENKVLVLKGSCVFGGIEIRSF